MAFSYAYTIIKSLGNRLLKKEEELLLPKHLQLFKYISPYSVIHSFKYIV